MASVLSYGLVVKKIELHPCRETIIIRISLSLVFAGRKSTCVLALLYSLSTASLKIFKNFYFLLILFVDYVNWKTKLHPSREAIAIRISYYP